MVTLVAQIGSKVQSELSDGHLCLHFCEKTLNAQLRPVIGFRLGHSDGPTDVSPTVKTLLPTSGLPNGLVFATTGSYGVDHLADMAECLSEPRFAMRLTKGFRADSERVLYLVEEGTNIGSLNIQKSGSENEWEVVAEIGDVTVLRDNCVLQDALIDVAFRLHQMGTAYLNPTNTQC